MGQNRGRGKFVLTRPSSLNFPVAFVMAAAINELLGRAFVKKKKKTPALHATRFVTTIA